jgi:CO/xanthine dehydrogenase FAD-binding subunit
VKPAPFAYARPVDLPEVLELLAGHGERARVLAGGQSLVPQLATREVRPALVVDINRVGGLDHVCRDGDGGVELGATVRQRTVERDGATAAAVPLLAQVLPLVGHAGTRNRGTVVGSIAFADPAAELPSVLVACGGSVEVRSREATRTIEAGELFVGHRRTALAATELVTSVRFPAADAGVGCCWLEFGRRPGDLPLVGVAAIVATDPGGRVVRMSVVCGGVHDTPWVVEGAGEVVGAAPTGEAVAHIAAEAARACRPVDDARTTAAHRRLLVGALVRRALAEACANAGRAHAA